MVGTSKGHRSDASSVVQAFAIGLATLASVAGIGPARADSVGPGPWTAGPLAAYPSGTTLVGPDAVQQVAVEEANSNPDAPPTDRTAEASYESTDPSVATVDPTGLISAMGDGIAAVVARFGSGEARVRVEVRNFAAGRPIHFANQVVPAFTKLGCNSGGCHGKASGQNGFRLSLLGFEPELDYETLVKEGRGRRLFPAAPDRSLLLTKATASVPHGGGKRMEPGSHEYRVVARWIAAGMPVGRPDAPTLDRITIQPDARVMPRETRRQLVVTAHYTDGHAEDVTRWAQYQTNDGEVANVAEGGRINTRDLSGQAAIMARYQGQVAVARVTVPLGRPIAESTEFVANNAIDASAARGWKALGIAPSGPCTDAEFIRRASLDINATLPDADAIRAFAADPAPDKRAALVDRLLERPEYAASFATKWADILRNKREGQEANRRGTYRFHAWIRENLARNTPYDQFVRSILAASGTPESSPPVTWYRRVRSTDAFVDDAAQVFLGMRLQCAKCHHHPFEKWSQEDYYGFSAFFARVARKPWKGSIAGPGGKPSEESVFNARTGTVPHPKTGRAMEPKGLGGAVIPVSMTEDPRQKLVDWMADPANPFFAEALVNRYWAHFFGRGIVEPLDDLRQTNPPANPELLAALARDFRATGYDLKALVRAICTSQVYGLSSIPNESNVADKQSFARHYPKRLTAEALLDAISRLTGTPTAFAGLPPGTRAIDLPDEGVASAFLDAFGRPKRDTPCECERVSDASLGQSLMLLNSDDVQSKLAAPDGRAATLAADPRPDESKLEELFWDAFGRPPSAAERDGATAHLSARVDRRKEAFEDILWALVNAKEFQFND